MNQRIRWAALITVGVLSFALIFSSQAFADEVTIIGEMTDQHQIVTKDNVVYEVADTDIGDDLMDRVEVGKKVKITGTVSEQEGQKVIDVTSFELVETD